jgi:simple sugar transport system permease protein
VDVFSNQTVRDVFGVIPVEKLRDFFLDLGDPKKFQGIPIPVIVMLVIATVFFIFFQYTRYGRMFYAVGGNREAARLSGVPVNRYRTAAYVLSALLATTGGLVLAARIGSGAVKAGEPYLLDGVAATFIGFAVLDARRPNILGTVVGAMFVGIMLNGLTMMELAWYYQDMVKGGVLIVSLGISYYLVKRRE